jgi:hypothetical protein
MSFSLVFFSVCFLLTSNSSIYALWPLQALPIFLDRIFHPVVAVVLSVTFVLAFGEVLYFNITISYTLSQMVRLIFLILAPGYTTSNLYEVWVGGGCKLCMACTYPHDHVLSYFIPYWEGKSANFHDLFKFCAPELVASNLCNLFTNIFPEKFILQIRV